MIVLSTIGSSTIDVNGHRLSPAAERTFAAVLFLAAERGRAIPRQVLQDLVFPADSVKNGAHSFRQMLYQLRRFGVDCGSDPHHVRIAAEAVIDPVATACSGVELEDAWLGSLAIGYLPGYFPSFSRPFAEWLDFHRASVTAALLGPLADQLAEARRNVDWTRSERVARACLALDSLHEEATIVIAEHLALNGSKAEAVHLLDRLSADIGNPAERLQLPSAVMRKRISERIPDAYARPETLLLGRDDELKRIAAFLDRDSTDSTTLLLLVGDPGIGKTRLVERVTRLCAIGGTACGQVGVQPYDVRRSLSFFTELVPQLLAMPGAIGCSPDSLQMLRRLQTGSPTVSGIESEALDAEAQFARILRAIDDVLTAITSERRLVLIADDAHDLDPVSARLLSLLASKRGTRRLLLIASMRPGSDAEALLRSSERCAVMRVAPLSETDSASLIDSLSHQRGPLVDRHLREWWVAIAGGNPLFLTMLAGHHSRTGEEFSIPASLNDLLMRRCETLSEGALFLFEACAVLGENATVPNIEFCTGLSARELDVAARELDRAGLLLVSGHTFRPVHRLLAEAAIEAAPNMTRALLHRRAAECAERGDGLVARASWSAADHWGSGDDADREASSLRACADQLMAIGRHGEACDLYVEAANHATESTTCELLNAAVGAAVSAGRHGTTLRILRRLGADGELSEPINEASATRQIIRSEALVESGGAFDADVARLLRIAEASQLSGLCRLRACKVVVAIAGFRWDPGLAVRAQAIQTTLPQETLDELLDHHAVTMIANTAFGDMDAAGRAAREVVRIVGTQPVSSRMSHRLITAAVVIHKTGAFDEACRLIIDRGTTLREKRLHATAYDALSQLATIHLDTGAFTRAAEIQGEADSLALEMVDRAIGGFSNRIRLALARRDVETASNLLDMAERIPVCTIGRFKWVTLAYRLRLLRQTRGVSFAEVEPLLAAHLVGRAYGDQDETALEVFHSLRSLGRADDAFRLAAEYRLHRLDRYTPEPDLQAFMSGPS